MTILGVDPGFERLGVAILKKDNGKEELVYSTCITSDKSDSPERRLYSLGRELEKIIKKFKPGILAAEKLFFFKNQKTIMGVAEARGMILYLAGVRHIPVYEFTPLEVKIALTGYGRAEKKQVQTMVKALLKLKAVPSSDDEVDAIAVAITASGSLKIRRYPQESSIN